MDRDTQINGKVKEQYTSWAATYDEEKVAIFARAGYSYEEFMDCFIKCCGLKDGMNILDIGSGTGLTAIALAKALSGNCKIVGIEPIEAMATSAKANIKKERLEDVIMIEKAPAESILGGDSAYDLVTCTFAIRHMNIDKALSEFIRVLKPKGKIVIADIYAPEKWRSALGKVMTPFLRFAFRFSKYKAETKSRVLTINEWRALLKGLGLTIIEVVQFPGKKEPEWELGRAIMAMGK
ncbi:MAG: methyltransferase domain-containing protein [Dehalococcoidia bacterium]